MNASIKDVKDKRSVFGDLKLFCATELVHLWFDGDYLLSKHLSQIGKFANKGSSLADNIIHEIKYWAGLLKNSFKRWNCDVTICFSGRADDSPSPSGKKNQSKPCFAKPEIDCKVMPDLVVPFEVWKENKKHLWMRIKMYSYLTSAIASVWVSEGISTRLTIHGGYVTSTQTQESLPCSTEVSNGRQHFLTVAQTDKSLRLIFKNILSGTTNIVFTDTGESSEYGLLRRIKETNVLQKPRIMIFMKAFQTEKYIDLEVVEKSIVNKWEPRKIITIGKKRKRQYQVQDVENNKEPEIKKDWILTYLIIYAFLLHEPKKKPYLRLGGSERDKDKKNKSTAGWMFKKTGSTEFFMRSVWEKMIEKNKNIAEIVSGEIVLDQKFIKKLVCELKPSLNLAQDVRVDRTLKNCQWCLNYYFCNPAYDSNFLEFDFEEVDGAVYQKGLRSSQSVTQQEILLEEETNEEEDDDIIVINNKK